MQDHRLLRFKVVSETIAWIAVFMVCLLFGYKLTRDLARSQPHSSVHENAGYRKGDKAPELPGLNYRDQKTVVVAVSSNCRFCIESEAFYRELIIAGRRAKNRRVVFVFPQSEKDVDLYIDQGQLKGLIRVGNDVFTSVPLKALQISATPTILTVDNTGTIQKQFIGKLPRHRELEVLAEL